MAVDWSDSKYLEAEPGIPHHAGLKGTNNWFVGNDEIIYVPQHKF
jgi:hypothetical protein